MRRIVLFACVLAALVFAAEFFLKPAVVSIAQSNVQAALKARAVSIQGLEFKFRPWTFFQGDLSIRELRYHKLKLRDLTSAVRWAGKKVFFDGLSGQILNGTINGSASVRLGKEPAYLVRLDLTALDLAAFVQALELKEKVRMTGLLGGKLAVKGTGARVNALSGNFSTGRGGGTLVITDTKFLENLARGSGQPLDIVVESFKNYHYTIGNVRLSLDEGSLVLDAGLEGESGKRTLHITLHDFSK